MNTTTTTPPVNGTNSSTISNGTIPGGTGNITTSSGNTTNATGGKHPGKGRSIAGLIIKVLKWVAIGIAIFAAGIGALYGGRRFREYLAGRNASKEISKAESGLKEIRRELNQTGYQGEYMKLIPQIETNLRNAKKHLRSGEYNSAVKKAKEAEALIAKISKEVLLPYYMTKKMDISKNLAFKSYIGRRDNNEDAFLAEKIDGNVVLAVADGMGGHLAGEVASQEALNVLRDTVKRLGSTEPARILREAIERANLRIYEMGHDDEHPERHNMGTTLTAAIVRNNTATVGNIGDSRTYLIKKDGTIKQLTKDHSLVQELIDKGMITPEEAKRHPQKNIITKALGIQSDIEIDPEDIKEITLEPGDYLLLCSDGLTDVMSDEEIAKTVLNAPSLKEAVDLLIEKAYGMGSTDNITVVLYRHPNLSGEEEKKGKKRKR
ncbi:Stp1/IreP family PP2C-type Ser/Thr phosphatase [Thermococcus sp. Bubb.Bath]|nr:Stp1/IreP family PP2C-type Ser/Thr phosphatase [Thermococcus sp. Bubb.Bath]